MKKKIICAVHVFEFTIKKSKLSYNLKKFLVWCLSMFETFIIAFIPDGDSIKTYLKVTYKGKCPVRRQNSMNNVLEFKFR